MPGTMAAKGVAGRGRPVLWIVKIPASGLRLRLEPRRHSGGLGGLRLGCAAGKPRLAKVPRLALGKCGYALGHAGINLEDRSSVSTATTIIWS